MRQSSSGGAHVHQRQQREPNGRKKNVEVAKRELKKRGIRLVAEDTGGKGGRTIYLDVSTGKVRMRKVSNGKVIEAVF